MSEDLRPCPFCGSNRTDKKFWSAGGAEHGPGCMDCGATAETVEKWNTRGPAADSDLARALSDMENLAKDGIHKIGAKGCLANKVLMSHYAKAIEASGLPELMHMLLYGFPENENGLTIPVVTGGERDMAIILFKRGKELPTAEQVEGAFSGPLVNRKEGDESQGGT